MRNQNATIVCLATGPSLTAEDCDYVRGCGVFTIAVNDAHRLAPWASMLYSSDRQWWRHYRGVPSFAGPKASIGSGIGKKNPIREYPAIQVFKNTGYSGLELDPDGLRNGKNSGFAAVNLAVHLGAKRIVLLGYNMGTPGGRTHFFGDHPHGLQNQPWLHQTFRRQFETMVEPLKAIGVEVINCTENTSLTAFPCASLRDVLKAKAVAA